VTSAEKSRFASNYIQWSNGLLTFQLGATAFCSSFCRL
jgi:hypothetical protein